MRFIMLLQLIELFRFEPLVCSTTCAACWPAYTSVTASMRGLPTKSVNKQKPAGAPKTDQDESYYLPFKPSTYARIVRISRVSPDQLVSHHLQALKVAAFAWLSIFTIGAFAMAASANYVFVTGGKKITTYRRSVTGTLSFSSQVDALANSGGPQQWNVFHLTLDRTASSLYSSQGDLFGEYDKSDTGRLTFLTNSDALGTFTQNLTFSHSNKFAYFAQCPASEWRLFGYIRQPDGILTRFDTEDTIPPNNGLALCPSDITSSALGYMAVSYGMAGFEGTHSIAVYQVTSSGELQ